MTPDSDYVRVPGPSCSVSDAPGKHADFLSVYERADAVEAAGVCPVCRVAYDASRRPGRDERVIIAITGNDTHDSLACPGCLPDEYVRDAKGAGYGVGSIQRMLDKAARDVAAGNRL